MVPRPTIGLAIEPDDGAGLRRDRGRRIGAGELGRPLGPGPAGQVRSRLAAAPCRRARRARAARRQIGLGEVLFGRVRRFRLRSRGFFASNRDQMQGLHPDPVEYGPEGPNPGIAPRSGVEYGRERPNPGTVASSRLNTGADPTSRVKLRRGHSPTGTTGSTTVIWLGRSDADLAAPVPAPAPRANSG